MELLPDSLYEKFNTENATLMAVFFDSATSADVTMDAIREIRSLSRASSASSPACPRWSPT